MTTRLPNAAALVHGSATNADPRCCRLPKLKFGWEYRSVQSPVHRHIHIYGLRGGCHTDPETASPETWDGKYTVVFFPTAATLPTGFIPPSSLQRQSREILPSLLPFISPLFIYLSLTCLMPTNLAHPCSRQM